MIHIQRQVDVKAFKGAGQCCPHNNIVLKNLNFTKNLVLNNLYNVIPRFPGWSLLPKDLAKARHLGLAAAGDPKLVKQEETAAIFGQISFLVRYL